MSSNRSCKGKLQERCSIVTEEPTGETSATPILPAEPTRGTIYKLLQKLDQCSAFELLKLQSAMKR